MAQSIPNPGCMTAILNASFTFSMVNQGRGFGLPSIHVLDLTVKIEREA